jgi:hypothetical protein
MAKYTITIKKSYADLFGSSAKSSEANLKEKPTKRNILLNWILI